MSGVKRFHHSFPLRTRRDSAGPVMSLLLFALLLLSGGCSEGRSFDSQTVQLLQASLDAGVGEIGVPGATMIVVRPDGGKWTGTSGLSDIEHNKAMASDLKFRIGSVSKTFTATVILQLVQEGRLSLDDWLESLLPGVVPGGAQISVKQLLNHSSGLFDYAQAKEPNFLLELGGMPSAIRATLSTAARRPCISTGDGGSSCSSTRRRQRRLRSSGANTSCIER